MSAIGDYVHLTEENYLAYGVTRKTRNNNAQNIGLAHQRFYNMIQRQHVKADLKKMQQQYNSASSQRLKLLKSLFTNRTYKENFVKKMIEGANGVPNSIINNPATFDMLVDAIEINDYAQNIKINLDKLAGTKSFAPLSGTQYRRISALLRRVDMLLVALQGTKSVTLKNIEANLKNLQGALKKAQGLNGDLNYVNNFLAKNFSSGTPQVQKASATSIDSIDPTGGAFLAGYLEQCQQTINISSYEAPLQASFAEFFGPLISEKAKNIATKQALNIFIQAFQGAGQQSIVQRQRQGTYINLHMGAIDDLVEEEPNIKKILEFDSSAGFSGRFVSQVGGKQDQKIDAILEFEGKEYNTSVKNVNLKNLEQTPKGADLSKIDVGGTNLLQFLIGLNDFEDNLGNHVLNLLVQHSDISKDPPEVKGESVQLKSLRKIALNLLEMQIMWSGLTGAYQGKNMNSVQILEIHDKANDGSDRIKLFDMVDVFNIGYANRGIKISPDIFSLENNLIKNSWQPSGTKDKRGQIGIFKRLTLALVDARRRKFNVALKKTILTNYGL